MWWRKTHPTAPGHLGGGGLANGVRGRAIAAATSGARRRRRPLGGARAALRRRLGRRLGHAAEGAQEALGGGLATLGGGPLEEEALVLLARQHLVPRSARLLKVARRLLQLLKLERLERRKHALVGLGRVELGQRGGGGELRRAGIDAIIGGRRVRRCLARRPRRRRAGRTLFAGLQMAHAVACAGQRSTWLTFMQSLDERREVLLCHRQGLHNLEPNVRTAILFQENVELAER